MNDPILEMKHISKRFDMTQALDEVSLSLYPDEIHALVGENEAGKSTLIRAQVEVGGQLNLPLARWLKPSADNEKCVETH